MADELLSEEWRTVADFPDHEVSDLGRVRHKGRSLQPALTPEGYWAVSLWKDGKGHTKRIPVLVCIAFHGSRPLGHDVAHADGTRTNDRPDNLRWATRAENMADAIGHGRTNRGERNPMAKLTEDQARVIKLSTEATGALAARYGVSKPAIADIRHNRNWKWL